MRTEMAHSFVKNSLPERSRALDALGAIPPDVGREDWIRAGFSALAAGLTIDDLVAWSEPAANYKSERDVRSSFKSFKPDGGLGPGTLFKLAKDHGWANKPARTARHSVPMATTNVASAADVWEQCKPATLKHDYLVRKGAADVPLDHLRVVPLGNPLRIAGISMVGALVVPVFRPDASISTLQFIADDLLTERLQSLGKPSKLNLPGARVEGWHAIGELILGEICYLVEGLATGWACWQSTGRPAVVCFGWGNVCRTATAMLELGFQPVLVPDVGKERDAETIARDLRCTVVRLPEGETQNFDVNDLMLRDGREVVKRRLEAPIEYSAQQSWSAPVSLVSKIDELVYPINELPGALRDVVEEVQGFTKTPIAMVATSALSALSLACQAHADVERATHLKGPCSINAITIAASGERKSTIDGYFVAELREHDSQQADAFKPVLQKHAAELSAWHAQRDGILAKIKDTAKASKSTETLEENLEKHHRSQPLAPRVPRLLRGDDTPENLAFVLAHQWPSAGVLSSEAGTILGAHGMGKESMMRNLSQLNLLWDGGEFSIGRRTSESFTVRGARLTIGLQVQESTLRSFFDSSKGLARGIGFFARFLIAWPQSTQGYRPFTEPPLDWPALKEFNRRISAILSWPVPIDDDGVLSPILMSFTADAKKVWVQFHDDVEKKLKIGGELSDVRDVASKAADNVARLAAILQIFTSGITSIDVASVQSACAIVKWHLNESLRFFSEMAMPVELAQTVRLDRWLIEYCQRSGVVSVPTKTVQQFGPSGLREKIKIEAAVQELTLHHRAKLVQTGRSKSIAVNPALLKSEQT